MNEPSPEKKPRSDGPDAAAIEKRVQYINKLSTFVSKVAETGLLKDFPCAKTWQRHCRDEFQTACACILAQDGKMDRNLVNAIMSLRKMSWLEVDFLAKVYEKGFGKGNTWSR